VGDSAAGAALGQRDGEEMGHMRHMGHIGRSPMGQRDGDEKG
jgi:hypothetical protein